MPIDYKLYVGLTKEIRAEVRKRSGNCCEGSPAYPDCRAENGKPHPVTRSRVVLTMAHLDHNPDNNDLTNLRDWCQRCHLKYDERIHAVHARETRLRKKAVTA